MRRTMALGWLVCSALLFVVALLTPVTSQAAEQGWLGVSTQELTSGLRAGLDYDGDGVLVTRVVDDSPVLDLRWPLADQDHVAEPAGTRPLSAHVWTALRASRHCAPDRFRVYFACRWPEPRPAAKQNRTRT